MRGRSAITIIAFIFGMLGVAYAIGFGGVRLVKIFLRWRALRGSPKVR